MPSEHVRSACSVGVGMRRSSLSGAYISHTWPGRVDLFIERIPWETVVKANQNRAVSSLWER